MNPQLDILLEKLGLNWTPSRLAEEFHPYELGEFIDTGGTALVFAGRICPRKSEFVLKLPRVPVQGEWVRWDTCIRALRHEGDVLTKCAGMKGLARIFADRSCGALPHLVIERLGASLDDRTGEDGDSPLDLRDSINLLFQLASTVRRMHSRGVLHGDVQDRNVLSGSDASWVLIDPTLPELSTYENGAQGVDRDVFGVAKTFLSAYYGVHNYDHVPEDRAAELEDHPELLNLLRRMLGKRPPSIRTALRVAGQVWSRDFANAE